ncbi:MAG: hypothetical protein AAFR15_15805 [Cyanobacteria bacterium J06627_15]
MKHLWGLAAGLLLTMVGGVARAETVALSFEVAETAPRRETSVAVGLSFELGAASVTEPPEVASLPEKPDLDEPVSPVQQAETLAANYGLGQLFEGGSDSLVAHAVGHAEGTRTADGGYTRYYNGHTDPGNGVWNLGTFSYQHGARSAAEADAKQLARLQRQATELRRQATEKGIELTLLEELNGIDLANQAPTTALDRGYIKWLDRAKRSDMGEAERVVWARTRSFIHPDTGRWNAPGLGNTLESVTRDQRRRQQAISKVLVESPARLE